MNTSVATNKVGEIRRLLVGALGVGLLLGLMACASTRQVKNVEESGFLGDYSQLHKGTKGQLDLVYIDANANWAQYTKLKIDPIELWASDDPDSKLGKLSTETQQRLIDLFHTALQEQLQTEYEIVDQAGPDVLVVHAAITEAKHSKPVVNLVSSVYMPLRVLSFAKQTITGTGLGVGAVQIEAEFLDGQTNQRLAAIVDRRAGTKVLRTKFNGTWGDVKLAFDWWAQRARIRLHELSAGVPLTSEN